MTEFDATARRQWIQSSSQQVQVAVDCSGSIRDPATASTLRRVRVWLHQAWIPSAPLKWVNSGAAWPPPWRLPNMRVSRILDPGAVLLGCNLSIQIGNHVTEISY